MELICFSRKNVFKSAFWKRMAVSSQRVYVSISISIIWSNYSDLTRPKIPQMVVEVSGNPQSFQGNLAWWKKLPFGHLSSMKGRVPNTSSHTHLWGDFLSGLCRLFRDLFVWDTWTGRRGGGDWAIHSLKACLWPWKSGDWEIAPVKKLVLAKYLGLNFELSHHNQASFNKRFIFDWIQKLRIYGRGFVWKNWHLEILRVVWGGWSHKFHDSLPQHQGGWYFVGGWPPIQAGNFPWRPWCLSKPPLKNCSKLPPSPSNSPCNFSQIWIFWFLWAQSTFFLFFFTFGEKWFPPPQKKTVFCLGELPKIA